MKAICVKCGNQTDNYKGSIKYPYCPKCFFQEWNDDHDKYLRWLDGRRYITLRSFANCLYVNCYGQLHGRCEQHDAKVFRSMLFDELRNSQNILELGCGEASPILPIGLGQKTIAYDIHKPYVETHIANNDYKDCRCADITTLSFPEKSFDAMVLLDVLEHLSKKQGEALLTKAESWCNKIIIFTPNGYLHNNLVDSNEYQNHLSGWTTHDLTKMGYKVRGFRGLKGIRGDKSKLKYRPHGYFALLSTISQYVTYRIPNFSHAFFAVKTTTG